MKKIYILLSCLYLTLSACSQISQKSTPDQVLKSFIASLAKSDIQQIQEWVTEDSRGMVHLLKTSLRTVDTAQMSKVFSPENLTIETPDIKDNNATIRVSEKASGNKTTFYLIKEKDLWKVAFDPSAVHKMILQK